MGIDARRNDGLFLCLFIGNKEVIYMKNEILLHIPHSSVVIPEKYKSDYTADLSEELIKMTDLYTDELFDLPFERIVFPVSRLVCDVERFRDDSKEDMAKIGMGAVYTSCHDLSLLRNMSEKRKNEILENWYDTHHSKFGKTVKEKLNSFGKCIIIDCHSFPPIPLPYEIDKSTDRPDICIGTDSFHTPDELAEILKKEFLVRGYSVKENSPFSGAIVPIDYYMTEKRVVSVMIEVNRKLYMDDRGKKTDGYQKVKNDIKNIIMNTFE